MEHKILTGMGYDYFVIPSGKFRRYGRSLLAEALDIKTTAQNFRDLFKFIGGLGQAYRLLRKIRPSVVFVKGGYVGMPVGIAAARLKIPLVLHESDAVFGMANKYLSKKAAAIGVGFPTEAYKSYGLDNLHFVGSPVRQQTKQGNKKAALKHFDLNEKKPNILIFGSSRGSTPINLVIFDNLEMLTQKYNLLHITGESDIERARFLARKLNLENKSSYRPYSFLKAEMGLAYAAADIAVTRAGATSLAELAIWKKPSIVIPRPSASNDHQNANARYMSRQGAIIVIPQSKLTGPRLLSELDRITTNKSECNSLSSQIAKFARADASEKMAQIVIKTANGEQA